MGAEATGTPLGSFVYRPVEDRWTWSDDLYAIHGFRPGDVVPTTALVESHRHPEDRADVRDGLDEALRTGRPVAGQHRIVDASGREHWVATVVQPRGDAGSRWLEGHVLDLTVPHTRSSARLATEMLAAAVESRTVIDVAKGALVHVYGVGPDAAFELLRWYSQHTQVRLRTLAERVVGAAAGVAALPSDVRHRVDGALWEACIGHGAPSRPGAGPTAGSSAVSGPTAVPDLPDQPDPVDERGLRTEVVHLPGATFVRVRGDLDLRTTPELADALARAVARTQAPAPVVVDLSDVDHLGPAGVAELLACHRRCRAAGTALRLVVRPDGPALTTEDDGPAVFADLASAAA